MKEEIFSIRFNKSIIEGVVRFDGYTVGWGYTSQSSGALISCTKITLVKDRITVYFSDGAEYIIHYNNDVEILKIPVKTETKNKKK